MIEKYFQSKIPNPGSQIPDKISEDLVSLIKKTPQLVDKHINDLEFSYALEAIWYLISSANGYIEKKAPWNLAKEGKTDELSSVLANLFEVLCVVAILVSPFMPDTAENIWGQLNLPSGLEKSPLEPFGMTIANTQIKKGNPLFPRLQK